jgi:hypothetical protein
MENTKSRHLDGRLRESFRGYTGELKSKVFLETVEFTSELDNRVTPTLDDSESGKSRE